MVITSLMKWHHLTNSSPSFTSGGTILLYLAILTGILDLPWNIHITVTIAISKNSYFEPGTFPCENAQCLLHVGCTNLFSVIVFPFRKVFISAAEVRVPSSPVLIKYWISFFFSFITIPVLLWIPIAVFFIIEILSSFSKSSFRIPSIILINPKLLFTIITHRFSWHCRLCISLPWKVVVMPWGFFCCFLKASLVVPSSAVKVVIISLKSSWLSQALRYSPKTYLYFMSPKIFSIEP